MPKRSQSEQQLDATTATSLIHSKSESALQPKHEDQEPPRDQEGEQSSEADVAVHLQQLEQTQDHLEETSRAASCSSLSTSSGVGSASSAASLHRRASTQARINNPLRGDTNLKIFLPSDNLALKAILSPKTSSMVKEDETKSGEDTGNTGSSSNLIDKLLFRNGTSAPMTPKKSMGSVVEEDLEAMSVVVMNPNLPPPPFANIYIDAKKRKVAYSQIVSLLKPQFYYINGLQVKTKRKETFFLAEFNGLRDTCFLRLDQLIRAYQEASKIKGMGPGVGFIDVDEDEDANAEVPLSDIVEDGHHTDDADVKRVFDLLWNDGPGQEFSFANMEKARDIDIDIESWKAIDKNDAAKAAEIRKGFEISKEDDYTLYRTNTAISSGQKF
ncbi:Hypothetical protein PHPALM_9388 [Phytophthora palmivora]|uniref:Uncharacterized protein n=1 Tax=Phytophthora palmivora TaxID=4796 RepID=A0A2P4Y7F0_9STRA|nr:Hypothetical protein PHPALM_9388 [Phytophthora palmivora]